MENKKSPKADMEKKKDLFILLGLVLALSFVYICFEWTDSIKKVVPYFDVTKETEQDQVPPTIQQNTPPPPQQTPPPVEVVKDVIEIVKDNEDVGDVKVNIPDDETNFTIPQVVDNPDDEPEDKIFVAVEEMPSFPGGEKEMMKFLAKNIKYPEIAAINNIRGRVTVSFVVNKDGKIVDVNVIKGVHSSLDQEAVRVVQSMPAWKPGKQSGKPVRTKYTLPVMFKLQ